MCQYADMRQRTREIVKARIVAGSVVVSLPKSILDPLDIKPGDQVVLEVGEIDGAITIRKWE